MYLVVRLDGDPTYWSLQPPEDSQPIVDELASSNDPISVAVTDPLVGTMLISPRVRGQHGDLGQMIDRRLDPERGRGAQLGAVRADARRPDHGVPRLRRFPREPISVI